jgi:hypothetical protein
MFGGSPRSLAASSSSSLESSEDDTPREESKIYSHVIEKLFSAVSELSNPFVDKTPGETPVVYSVVFVFHSFRV